MTLFTKVASTIVTSGLVATLFAAPVFAADNEISGNGPQSDNVIVVANEQTTVVEQTNVTNVVTLVGVFQNTGGNTASGNMGDATINTGNATSVVKTKVGGSANAAVVPDCGCDTSHTNLISGNGPKSTNVVVDLNKKTKVVKQTNLSSVLTAALVGQNTGGNKAKNNSGNASITTKNTDSTVVTKVKAPANVVN
jgi:hypothetical protein